MGKLDFSRHSDDYAKLRPGFPPSFYERLGSWISYDGLRAVDLATGPGVIATELAVRGAHATGVDIAPGQVEAAKRVAEERGVVDRTHYVVADVADTGLDSNAFDLVTAGQCWHWFDDSGMMAEVDRILVPGGHLVIADYSYMVSVSEVASATEDLVLKYNPGWPMAGWAGTFPERIPMLTDAGFTFAEAFCYDHAQPFTHESWRGRIRTCNGIGSGGLPPAEVERFNAELAELLDERFPEPLTIPHRVWCVIGRSAQ